jgi:hypothetical protein
MRHFGVLYCILRTTFFGNFEFCHHVSSMPQLIPYMTTLSTFQVKKSTGKRLKFWTDVVPELHMWFQNGRACNSRNSCANVFY